MVDVVRRRRMVFAAVSLAVVVAVIVASRAVLLPFVLGVLLAYVLHPVVGSLTRVRLGGRSVPRWVAVLGIYVTLITTLVVTLLAVTPRVVSEGRSFALHEVPALRQRFERDWMPRVRSAVARVQGTVVATPPREVAEAPGAEARVPDDGALRVSPEPGGAFRVSLPAEGVVIERVDDAHWTLRPRRHLPSEGDTIQRELRKLGQGHAADVLRVGRGIIGGVIGGIFNFFMTLMVSAYLLVTEARVLGFFRSLVRPESRDSFDHLLRRLDRGLSGVVRGQLIICLVNGSLSAVGFALADLKYWPTLAVVATVFSLIPIFGTVLSSVPAVAIGLTQGFGTALFVLLWIIGIHQLEANLLNPKIMGDQAKIHPVLVVFSLLAGEHAFGILGALLAVPVMSVAQTLFLHWRTYALGYGEPATDSVT
ncbi:MAG: AI-2E family transporter [Deltaproteobacteria bacterium]|nr:AI-2E family transporter [Myxococcales bacterium]MDP3216941.1 AI-2E family transporter [Deltaproteobacteria bacterium]